MKTVHRLRDQQHAKCEMDADQYIDEHPSPIISPQRWTVRYRLCMEAAGYPTARDYYSQREISADTYRRMRELWVKSGKSQSDLDWFDKYVDRLLSSIKD